MTLPLPALEQSLEQLRIRPGTCPTTLGNGVRLAGWAVKRCARQHRRWIPSVTRVTVYEFELSWITRLYLGHDLERSEIKALIRKIFSERIP